MAPQDDSTPTTKTNGSWYSQPLYLSPTAPPTLRSSWREFLRLLRPHRVRKSVIGTLVLAALAFLATFTMNTVWIVAFGVGGCLFLGYFWLLWPEEEA